MEREIRVYNDLAPHYRAVSYPRWDIIEMFIESLPPNSTLLDIGCGSGRFLDINDKIVNVGLDPAIEQCKLCREKGHTDVLCANGLRLPFRDETFDHAICVHVIHHFPTAELRAALLRELCRVLRVAGTAIVTAWSTSHGSEREELVPWTDTRGVGDKPGLERFFHYFEPGEFGELAELVDGLICLEEVVRDDGRLDASFVRVF